MRWGAILKSKAPPSSRLACGLAPSSCRGNPSFFNRDIPSLFSRNKPSFDQSSLILQGGSNFGHCKKVTSRYERTHARASPPREEARRPYKTIAISPFSLETNPSSLLGVDRRLPFFMNFPSFCNAREMRGRYNPRRRHDCPMRARPSAPRIGPNLKTWGMRDA